MSILREKRKKEKRAKIRRMTADWMVVGILIAVAVCCIGYLVWHNYSIHVQELEYERMREQEEAVSEETEMTEQVTETEETESTEDEKIYCEPVYDFEELEAENEDIYAWIVVPGTMVDYPVLQSKTDNYYLDYNIDHTKGYPGCIYTNSCNQKDFSDYITVLYGHNMKKGTMFGSLHRFEDENFFAEHDKIYVYTKDRRLTYTIRESVKFSDVYIPAEYPVNELAGRDAFLGDLEKYMDNRASHSREGVSVGDSDRIITLSTCVNGERNRRYVVIGVLTEEAYYCE